MVTYALYGVAALAVLPVIAIAFGTSSRGSRIVYGASLVLTLLLCTIALRCLLNDALAPAVTLPL